MTKLQDDKNKKRLQGTISSVSIRGFRSLADVQITSLPRVAVLIGSNGAGKSNFIRFFEMIGWMFRSQKLQEYVEMNGSGDDQLFMGAKHTPRIDAKIAIDTQTGIDEYRFSLRHVAPDRLILIEEAYRFIPDQERESNRQWVELPMPSNETVIVERTSQDKTAGIVVNLLRNCTTYQFHDTSAKADIKLAWDVTENGYLRSNGGNLAPILYRLQKEDVRRYNLIVRQVRRVLPGFGDFDLRPSYGKILLRWTSVHSQKSFGAHLTSDGSLRLFSLLTLLNLPDGMLSDVMMFDEPELGLHPHAIGLVADMLKRVGSRRQVIIATQSPTMVDCFDLENVIVADLQEGATRFRLLDRKRYQQWLDDDYSLSDLWLKDPVGINS